MQIYPLNSTTGTSQEKTAADSTGAKSLGQEDFLKLLAVQMQAQDPLNPMKDTEFVAQMASFTSLEQMKSLTTSFNSFITQQRSVDAQTYLGKSVTVLDGDAGLVTGEVSGVSFKDGLPQLVVGGKTYDPALVTLIRSASTNS